MEDKHDDPAEASPLPGAEREGPAPQAWEGEGAHLFVTARARELRRRQTPEERRLRGALRNRAFMGLKWRRQEPIAGYFPDFVCHAVRLIIELDGEQHGDNRAYDERRTHALERAGYTVIRFPNSEVNRELSSVLERVARAVEVARAGGPHPPTPASPTRAPPSPHRGEGTRKPNPLDNPMPFRARRPSPIDRKTLAVWSPLPGGEREGPAGERSETEWEGEGTQP